MQTSKILVDTNVILDVLYNRPEFVKDSLNVWRSCELHEAEGYISALTVPNIVYIMRRELTAKKTQELVDKLLMIFRIVELTAGDIKNAADMLDSDYEDSLQICAAKRIGADFIVTRNETHFKNSPIEAKTPKEYLATV